jgi:hypothetical protein
MCISQIKALSFRVFEGNSCICLVVDKACICLVVDKACICLVVDKACICLVVCLFGTYVY